MKDVSGLTANPAAFSQNACDSRKVPKMYVMK